MPPEDQSPPEWSVRVRACPRRVKQKVIAVLAAHKIGGFWSREQMAEGFITSPYNHAGYFTDEEKAQALADALVAVGCDAHVSEMAPFP